MADPVTDLSPSGDDAPVRNVRRRLVQSTLFPLKPPLNKPEENDDSGDEQDEDYCDTKKNRRKRKSKGKITPLNKGSKVSGPLFDFQFFNFISWCYSNSYSIEFEFSYFYLCVH